MACRTQKATGLMVCHEHLGLFKGVGLTVPEVFVGGAQEFLDPSPEFVARLGRSDIFPSATFTFFIRPCPMRPRHGFVESRAVKWPYDVVDPRMREQNARIVIDLVRPIAEEVVAVEPEAEIMVMPYLRGSGAIWLPDRLVIGPKPDSATSGSALTFMGAGLPANLLKPDLLEEAGIESTPYYELVDCCVVQLRDGPPVPTDDAFIPKRMKVRQLLRAADYPDLVEWERVVAEAPHGTVVVLGKGMSLASHYAAHCVARGVPCVPEDRAPEIGQYLVPPKNKVDEDHIVQQVLHGMMVGEAMAENIRKRLTSNDLRRAYGQMMVAGIHMASVALAAKRSEPVWDPTWRLVGFAMQLLFRTTAAGCLGERRHVNFRSGYYDTRDAMGAWQAVRAIVPTVEVAANRRRPSRWSHQRNMLTCSVQFALHELLSAATMFSRRDWFGSYGGNRWADISLATLRLGRALRRFVVTRKLDALDTALAAAHSALTLVHNCAAPGWTKILPVAKAAMDAAAKAPGLLLLGGWTQFCYLECITMSVSDSLERKFLARYTRKTKSFPPYRADPPTYIRAFICDTCSYRFIIEQTDEGLRIPRTPNGYLMGVRRVPTHAYVSEPAVLVAEMNGETVTFVGHYIEAYRPRQLFVGDKHVETTSDWLGGYAYGISELQPIEIVRMAKLYSEAARLYNYPCRTNDLDNVFKDHYKDVVQNVIRSTSSKLLLESVESVNLRP